MTRIGLIAGREFAATVGTKGFIIGLLMMPALLAVVILIAPRIMNARTPQVRGEIAVVDRTGQLAADLRAALDPAAIEARRIAELRRALPEAGAAVEAASRTGAGAPGARVPDLRLIERPADADVEREKRWLLEPDPPQRRLALVVVHADAVVREAGAAGFGSYDLYVSSDLDEETESVVFEGLREALVDARLRASSLDRAAIETIMRVPRPSSVIVAAGGEQQARRGFNRMLPFVMGVLLFMGVVIGGQTLMTSTIEEKSSRVVEVLLAAVSPFELMAGKLLGQLGVGLVVMSLYVGLGLFGLFSFAMLGLLDPLLLVYLLVFFLITYVVFGALMMAVGAAVNQIADAQSLMGPIMLLLMAPYVLTPIVARAPDSTFSVVVSFIPPVNTFMMLARLASDTPPPAWQPLLTIVIGLGAALGCVWFAAKVFKVGLLMHGKPPNVATLVRWARAA